MPEGYCTADDVRQALQEASLDAAGEGPLSQSIVEAAIDGQTDWIRRRTDGHWFDTAASSGSILPTSPRSYGEDVVDVPSTPHAQHNQLLDDTERRYPRQITGRYTRVTLAKRWVDSLTSLEVRDGPSEWSDWVAAADKESGRGNEYYLQTDPETGLSHVYLDTGSLGPLRRYEDAVVATYDYGHDGIPGAIRRGQAALAGADLVMDDDVKTAMPDNGQLIAVGTKADRLIKQAMRLLGPFLQEADP